MNLPTIGASMGDAARTRENEKPDICSGCDNCPEECGYTPDECEAINAQAADEERYDAMREL